MAQGDLVKNVKKGPAKTIQKKNRPKPRKVKQTFQGGHTAQLESLLADRVANTNIKLKVLKPDQKLIKDVKAKEARRKEKYG